MFSRRLLLILLICACAPVSAKSPITHEAMWLMKRAGSPAPSPDGKWVVFSVTEPAYDSKDQVSDLWIVPSDGSARPRRLTFTKGSEGSAEWSPDSKRLAFTARREGDSESQVYVLDLAAGGEAMRITALSTGASSPKWSPDGEWLLFQSTVYPGAADDEANRKIAAERKARKYTAHAYDGFPVRYWDRWLDERRAHLFVQKAEAGARAKDLLAGTRLAAEAGFGAPRTTSGQSLQAVWAPDGKSAVFTASINSTAAAYSNVVTDLYQVQTAGGEPRKITGGGDSFSHAAFRPDGKALYALWEKNGPMAYYLAQLVMYEWPAAKGPVKVTEALDRSVGSFAFTPDSRRLYLTAEDAGHEKLYSAPAGGGATELVFDMTSGAYLNLAIPERAAKTMIFANFESGVNPAEVVLIDASARRHSALTQINAEAVEKIDWQPLRHFWFTSDRGKKIHNLMALPPAFDESRKYPLVVFVHGGPHTMSRDQFHQRWNFHLMAAPGYVILMTNYTGSTGFGEKFSQEIQGDPLKGPGEEILEAVDEALKRFPFLDGTRMAAGGASYGGHMANWLQATTTRFRCLYSHAGLINLESQWGTSDVIYHREINNGGPVWEQGRVWREQNPIRFAANFKTPMLLTVGERDYRVPLNQTLENWSVLQRLRVPSRLVVFPEENHWILKGEDNRYFYEELHAWWKKYLQ